MLKPPGLPCPNCMGIFCAEYAQQNQPARWTCHNCGSTGEIAGDISIRPKPAATEPAKEPKPHWRDRNLVRRGCAIRFTDVGELPAAREKARAKVPPGAKLVEEYVVPAGSRPGDPMLQPGYACTRWLQPA